MTVQTYKAFHVAVHYFAAEDSFKSEAHRTETVGHLKARVLVAFELSEGQTSDGNTVVYTLYLHRTPLESPNQTLGELAGDEHTLQLKLVQQITQG
jgi:hypothetical protein